MAETAAFIAVNRFGLGARPGELSAASGDPRGWLQAQLSSAVAPKALRDLKPSSELVVDAHAERKRIRSTRQMGENAGPDERLQIYYREAAARTRAQIQSRVPFHERLVAFWSNHFTVSTKRATVRPVVGAFEREAIRPHVTGRFLDMLNAAARHPAMLFYLDNHRSVGPNSPAGRQQDRGLNENLAREILELHTLGVDGGYTQADVRTFALMLTGWSVDGRKGVFRFKANTHQPGAKTILGRRYPEAGVEEANAALATFAAHPATARHVATKLARHFIADDPPEAAVARIAKVFERSGGDLAAVSRTLIDEPEAWADPLAKLKTPNEVLVSTLRATRLDLSDRRLLRSLNLLGQIPFHASSPEGWPDTAAEWFGPEALMRRVDLAYLAGRKLGPTLDPKRLFAETIAPVAAPGTEFAVHNAASAADAIGLVLASAEFQRR